MLKIIVALLTSLPVYADNALESEMKSNLENIYQNVGAEFNFGALYVGVTLYTGILVPGVAKITVRPEVTLVFE